MKESNRKKLETIKSKVMNAMLSQMSLGEKRDKEFSESLSILGKAIDEIERIYGRID